MRRLAVIAVALTAPASAAAVGAQEERPALSCYDKHVPARVDGTPGNDVLASDAAVAQRVRGFGGEDLLTAAGPGDCLQGGRGADRLVAAPEGSLLRGGHGDDRLAGVDGPDELRGDQGRDVLDGGAGDDDLDGALVSEIFARGTYMQDVPYEQERDVLRGGTGNDELLAAYLDVADGGPGDDRVLSDAWPARLAGGEGDDYISSAGADVIDAGPGDDAIMALDESSNSRYDPPQPIDCGAGQDAVEADLTDELSGCERVRVERPATRLRVRPRRAGPRTVFRVTFRAPATMKGVGRRFLALDANARTRRCSRRGRRVAATRKGALVSVTLAPPRRGWCPGRLPLVLYETGRRPGEDYVESFALAIARVRVAAVTSPAG